MYYLKEGTYAKRKAVDDGVLVDCLYEEMSIGGAINNNEQVLQPQEIGA